MHRAPYLPCSLLSIFLLVWHRPGMHSSSTPSRCGKVGGHSFFHSFPFRSPISSHPVVAAAMESASMGARAKDQICPLLPGVNQMWQHAANGHVEARGAGPREQALWHGCSSQRLMERFGVFGIAFLHTFPHRRGVGNECMPQARRW